MFVKLFYLCYIDVISESNPVLSISWEFLLIYLSRNLISCLSSNVLGLLLMQAGFSENFLESSAHEMFLKAQYIKYYL